jgi:hypothetical protein
VTYVGFVGVLLRAMRSGAVSSCGCAGNTETPPTAAHIVLNVLLAAGAIAAAVGDGGTGVITIARSHSAGEVAVVCCYAVVCAWLGWVVLTVAPRLRRTRPA